MGEKVSDQVETLFPSGGDRGETAGSPPKGRVGKTRGRVRGRRVSTGPPLLLPPGGDDQTSLCLDTTSRKAPEPPPPLFMSALAEFLVPLSAGLGGVTNRAVPPFTSSVVVFTVRPSPLVATISGCKKVSTGRCSPENLTFEKLSQTNL